MKKQKLKVIFLALIFFISIFSITKLSSSMVIPKEDNLYFPNAMGVYSKWNFTTGDSIYSSPAIADLDGDGTLEVLVGSDDNKLYCIDHLGVEEWSYTTGANIFSSPAVVDL
ncbi:MAG: hypothetical protein ACTSQN_06920, partial [Candidatus Heimdallarchaeota archaeon]